MSRASFVCFVVLLGTLAHADEPWYATYAARRSIELPKKTERGDGVLLRLGTAGLTRADARDIRIVANHQRALPSEVVAVGPGDVALVRFRAPDPEFALSVYFGGKSASAAKRPKSGSSKDGLLLELWELPDGPCDSWNDAEDLLEAASKEDRRIGVATPSRIFQGIPPLGRTRDYLALYTGAIKVRRPGEHVFETVSDGASFLRVNGKLVASWPGFHGTGGRRDVTQRGEHSGRVKLAEGLHEIEYVVAPRRGGVHLVGWAEPGDKNARLISAKHYHAWRFATTGALENRKGTFTADFDWRVESDTNSDAERHAMAKLSFRFRGDTKGRQLAGVRWKFGDGQTGAGMKAEHVYLAHGRYEVGVSATFASGESVEATRNVVVRLETLERLDLNGLLEKYYRDTRGYDLRALPPPHLVALVWLRGKDYRWEDDLWAVVDEWYRRGLTPREGKLAKLGLRRAVRLLDDGRRVDRARDILKAIAADAPKREVGDEARARLAWLAAQGSSPVARARAKTTLRELYQGGRGDASRRAGLYLARAQLADGEEDAGRKILELFETDATMRRFEGTRVISANSRRIAFENLLRRKKLREAGEALERWEWEFPMDLLRGTLQIARARYLLARGRDDEAVRELEPVARLAGATREKPRVMLLEAEILARKNATAAREKLERLIEEFPRRPESEEAASRLEALR